MTIKDNLTSTIVKIISNNVTFNWFKPYKTDDESESIGTGFFINNQGYILSCSHVVIDSINLFITIPSIGKERIEVEVVGICDDSDLALLKTKSYQNTHWLEFGDSDKIKPGDQVIAIGYPLGQDRLKQTSGIISGRQDSHFQTDTPINPGNSGGPLVDKNFKVIGVNSSKMMFADNVGYASPIYQFQIIQEMMENKLNSPSNEKMIIKPNLYCNFNNSSEDLIKYYGGLHVCPHGYYIKKIHEQSISTKHGLKNGDILCEFGTKQQMYKIDNYGECKTEWSDEKIHIYDLMHRYTLNDELKLKYWRKNSNEIIEQTINFKDFKQPIIRRYYKIYDEIDYVIFGGLIVMKLTGNHLDELFGMDVPKKMIDHLAMYAHLKNRFDEVLIITQIFPGSHLTKIESLHIGDIITCVNNIPVKTLDEFRSAIKKVHTVDDEHFIKIKTKLNTVVVCNLKTLLNEEEFLSNNFKYNKDPLFDEFNETYPSLLDDKELSQIEQQFTQQYEPVFESNKTFDIQKPISDDDFEDQNKPSSKQHKHTHTHTHQITHTHSEEDIMNQLQQLQKIGSQNDKFKQIVNEIIEKEVQNNPRKNKQSRFEESNQFEKSNQFDEQSDNEQEEHNLNSQQPWNKQNNQQHKSNNKSHSIPPYILKQIMSGKYTNVGII